MKFIYNNQRFKFRRQKLRDTETSAEDLLWRSLRRKKLNGVKFFRQYSVGPCVLDFYCPDVRLAIELDGHHHYKNNEQFAYDEERAEYLKENDIKVLRFFNADIADSINAVLEKIKSEVEGISVSCASPSLRVREGVRGESYRAEDR